MKFLSLTLAVVVGVCLCAAHSYAQTLVPVNAPVAGNCYSLAIDAQNNLYLGTTDGFFVSKDQGANWKLLDSTGYPAIRVVAASNGWLVNLDAQDGLWLSNDQGNSWGKIDAPLGRNFESVMVTPDSVLLVATLQSGIQRSSDVGQTWHKAVGIDSNNGVNAFAMDAKGTIYAGAQGEFHSFDDGMTWIHDTSAMLDSDIQSLTVTENGSLFCGTYEGVLRSNDTGRTWENAGLQPTGDIQYLLSYKNILCGVSATDQTAPLVYSADQGLTWHGLNPRGLGIENIAIDSNGFVYVIGIPDSGKPAIYKTSLPLDQLSVGQISQQGSVTLTSYPNPASSQVTIVYDLPSRQFSSLKLYNTNGAVMRTLVEGDEASGNHSIRLSTNDMPAGVYWYRLQSGESNQMGKLTILR